ncbi:acyl-CoA dehydrogenase family protein [Kitasatospora sp. P5_F3]
MTVSTLPPVAPTGTPAGVAALAHRSGHAVEDARRLTPELAAALSEAGFARHFVPRRWGGTAGTFRALVTETATVAESCAATAWCGALYAAHGRLAAYLPEAGQRELWGASPDVRIAAAVVPPSGTAVRVGGGWRLSGEWAYASGIDHAQWVLLASRVEGPEIRIFALPREQFGIRDTWRTLGLRGTGSHTVVVRDAFVPDRLTLTQSDLGAARPDAARCHRVPFPLVAQLQFAAPILGAAQGARRAWEQTAARRVRVDGQATGQAVAGQQVLARSAGEIQAARLLLEGAAARADDGVVTPLSIAENQRDCALAAELAVAAVDRLFRSCGAAGQADGHPVQRHWRDVTAAAGHAALRFETAAAAYSAVELAGPGRSAG